MKKLKESPLSKPNTANESKYLKTLYKGLFGNDLNNEIELKLTFGSVREVLKKADLTDDEKAYLVKFDRRRVGDCRNRTPDCNRYYKNLNIKQKELLLKNENDLANILAYFPPRILHEQYGEAVLFWVWYNIIWLIGDPDEFIIYEKYLSENTELVGTQERYKLLAKAKRTMWTLHTRGEPYNTLALYDAFISLPKFTQDYDTFKMFNSNDFEVETDYSMKTHEAGRSDKWMWKDFDKDGKSLEEEVEYIENNKYPKGNENQRAFGRKTNWEGRLYKLWLDSPFGIILKYKGKPIAIVAFSMKDESTIFINQFQQIPFEKFDRFGRMIGKRVDEIAKKTNWQQKLYEIVADFAKNKGYKKIIIQSGRNNSWTKENRTILDEENGKTIEKTIDIPHLSLDIAKKVYDIFAVKNDFKKNDNGNYSKDI